MKSYLRITLSYLVFGVLWIFASDRLVELIAGDLRDVAYFQTLKGLTFVMLSALLISTLTRETLRKLREHQQEKDAIFHKTLEGSHHILLNYLNSMQLVTMEAEDCPGFSRETLKIAREASQQAEVELKRLNTITTITTEQIDSTIYRDLRRKKSR